MTQILPVTEIFVHHIECEIVVPREPVDPFMGMLLAYRTCVRFPPTEVVYTRSS